jgi:ankyrin repeat protein
LLKNHHNHPIVFFLAGMSGQDLLDAAEAGNLDKVKSLLDQGVNINHKNWININHKNN